MNNVDIFLDKYKVLEDVIKNELSLTDYDRAVGELLKKIQFKNLKNDLNYIREIRNLLQHKPKINGNYCVEPSIDVINKIDDVINYVKHPPKVYDKCILINKVCCAGMNDMIYPYMLKMRDNDYTHIPIVEDGILKGVFSDNTLFGALLEDEIIYDKERTIFKDDLIYKYCLLENHVTEMFDFVSRDCYVEDAREKFAKVYDNGKRLGMLFITQHGNRNEKLLGVLTPWDILK